MIAEELVLSPGGMLPRFDGIGKWLDSAWLKQFDNVPDTNAFLTKVKEWIDTNNNNHWAVPRPFSTCPSGHALRIAHYEEANRLVLMTGWRPTALCEWAVCELCGSAWVIPRPSHHICAVCLCVADKCICETTEGWRKMPADVPRRHVAQVLDYIKQGESQALVLSIEPCWAPPDPEPADPLGHLFGWDRRSELREQHDPGFVYVARAPSRGDNALKIGKAKRPEVRLSQFKTVLPDTEFVSLFEVPNAGALERALHKYFSEQRIAGEWFNVTVDEVWEAVKRIMPEDVACIATGLH